MEEKIINLISKIFFVDKLKLNMDTSQNEIIQWDSIGHLNLITSLEEEFGIIYTDQQIIEMLNVKLVIEITNEAINNNKI